MKRARSDSSEDRPRTPPNLRRSGKILQVSETFRSVKGDVGSIGQNHIRSDVAQQMTDEMLCCDIDEFLSHYAPFCPTNNSIDRALKELERKEPLQGNKWKIFIHGKKPSKTGESEGIAFKGIKDIVKALTEHDSMAPRTCNFKYSICGDTHMAGEIAGSTFRIDGCFSPLSSTPLAGKVVVSQVAVAAEFKKNKSHFPDNRQKLVSAANHIMNDDPRRMWMYGITIEGENTAIWYFSRSHSVMSKSFDFTEDPRKFVTVLLSLLFATELEMGFDPTVHRIRFKDKICYVYELTPKAPSETQKPLYFRTTATIFNPHIACISGRKTRVWRAIPVTGPNGLEETGDKEVVLKDVWLDKGSRTEKQNQDSIYGKLRQIQESDYKWIEGDYWTRVKGALANIPDNLPFMRILYDSEGVDCKDCSPSAKPDRSILSSAKSEVSPSQNVLPSSTQNRTSNFATGTSHDARMSMEQKNCLERRYMAKTQYRLVYAEVGYALHDVQSIDKAFKAINDVFIALVLLFLAGWVHRDISTGNIIIVENNECIHGLLSDFEYAKAMSNENGSPDPKTGTPYFMPLEIHRGKKYTPADAPLLDDDDYKKYLHSDLLQVPKRPKAILRYTSNHDQESLMWVALWIVYGLVHWEKAEDREKAKEIRLQIFANTRFPTSVREYFFREADLQEGEFRQAFHPNLGDVYPRCFHMMRLELYTFCTLAYPKEENYYRLFNRLSDAFDTLLAKVTGNPGAVPLMVRSGSENQADVEVEGTREETGHTMTLRSHVQDLGHSRLWRQY